MSSMLDILNQRSLWIGNGEWYGITVKDEQTVSDVKRKALEGAYDVRGVIEQDFLEVLAPVKEKVTKVAEKSRPGLVSKVRRKDLIDKGDYVYLHQLVNADFETSTVWGDKIRKTIDYIVSTEMPVKNGKKLLLNVLLRNPVITTVIIVPTYALIAPEEYKSSWKTTLLPSYVLGITGSIVTTQMKFADDVLDYYNNLEARCLDLQRKTRELYENEI